MSGQRQIASRARAAGCVVVAALGLAAGWCGRAAAQADTPTPPASEAIQKQREEAERQRLEYEKEKAKIDRINERVRRYKQLQASIPFEPVPNTSNMVQVFVNNHDIHAVARQIYDVTDDATDAGFQNSYWPKVMYINRAKDYDGGYPLYGKLDPQAPELNVALFPAVRKQGYKAVVADITNADSSLALEMTVPVVKAYRKRLEEEVTKLAARSGDVVDATGPTSMPGDNHVALFRGLPTDPRDSYPPRKVTAATVVASTEPVAVDRAAPLEPAPPALALRQGVNMLGPNYQGYNMQYTPDHFDLQPEFAPIAFLGGRDPEGNARTQPGMHFGLNQRFFGFLLVNESAFVAFSSGGAPPMNGGSISAGLDLDLGYVNFAALAGMTGVNVIGEFNGGPSFTGKVKVPVGSHVQIMGVGLLSRIDHLLIPEEGRNGVVDASYFGLGVLLR